MNPNTLLLRERRSEAIREAVNVGVRGLSGDGLPSKDNVVFPEHRRRRCVGECAIPGQAKQ